MKRKNQSVLLASLLAIMLAACSSTSDSYDRSTAGIDADAAPATASTSGTSGTASTSGTAGTSATGASASGSMASGDSGQASTATPAQTGSAPATPNSTVTSIEVVQRPADSATGAGTVAGAAVGGAAPMGSDRVYRITLRMDDGQTQVITQEWAPTFSTGDRVRSSGGAIMR